jgi:hypothetical protein
LFSHSKEQISSPRWWHAGELRGLLDRLDERPVPSGGVPQATRFLAPSRTRRFVTGDLAPERL